jgi:3-hydroxybutyryl-CoA dehydrogenase
VDLEGVDAVVEQGFGYPMGPYTLMDTIGLDVCLAVQHRLHETFATSDYAPPALLEHLVATGWVGRKNATGFRAAKWAAADPARTRGGPCRRR